MLLLALFLLPSSAVLMEKQCKNWSSTLESLDKDSDWTEASAELILDQVPKEDRVKFFFKVFGDGKWSKYVKDTDLSLLRQGNQKVLFMKRMQTEYNKLSHEERGVGTIGDRNTLRVMVDLIDKEVENKWSNYVYQLKDLSDLTDDNVNLQNAKWLNSGYHFYNSVYVRWIRYVRDVALSELDAGNQSMQNVKRMLVNEWKGNYAFGSGFYKTIFDKWAGSVAMWIGCGYVTMIGYVDSVDLSELDEGNLNLQNAMRILQEDPESLQKFNHTIERKLRKYIKNTNPKDLVSANVGLENAKRILGNDIFNTIFPVLTDVKGKFAMVHPVQLALARHGKTGGSAKEGFAHNLVKYYQY